MNRIEKGTTSLRLGLITGLHALHAETREAEQASQVQQPPTPATTVAPQLIPFALVNSVADSSPASEAVPSNTWNVLIVGPPTTRQDNEIRDMLCSQ